MTNLSLNFNAPTVPLSINKAHSLHWAARRRLTDPWRDVAAWSMRSLAARAWLTDGQRPVTISVDLPFRTKARRDPHNYVGTVVKACVDGLVIGGLVPDDTPEWATVLEPTLSIHPDKSRPLVALVTITPRSTT